MAQSLAKILVHTVFSTKDRRPLLRDKRLREELHRYLGGILANHDCQPIIVGGVEDHVHILSMLSRTCQASSMVKEVKRSSSLWLKTKGTELRDFSWQNGYGIFSIGFSQIDSVRNYIAEQEEHHRKRSFQDEFRLAEFRSNNTADFGIVLIGVAILYLIVQLVGKTWRPRPTMHW